MKALNHLLFSVFFLLSLSTAVSACFCGGRSPGKTEKLVAYAKKEARAVFSGKVIKISPLTDAERRKFGTLEIQLQLRQTWKGEARETVSLFIPTDCCLCSFSFKEGEEYLIYAYGEARNLTTSICTRTKILRKAKEDLKYLREGK